MRKTLFVSAVMAVGSVAQAAVLVDDNFASFAPGNLVGQPGWTQQGPVSLLPVQVAGGKATLPFIAGGTPVTGVDNQDAKRFFTTTTSGSVYLAMTLTVKQTPATGNSSYIVALRDSTDAFDNFRFAVSAGVTPGTFVLQTRGTGQGGNPFVGAGELPLNQTVTVIGAFNLANPFSDWKTYVSPTSATEGSNTVYTSQTLTTGNPAGFGALILSQFANATTVTQAGVEFGQVAVTTTFAEAYNAVIPEPTTLALVAGMGVFVLRRRA